MSTSKAFALIAGVGPGTGRSLALKFSQGGYSCILMSRSKASWSPVVEEIKSLGRVAHGFDCDVSDSKSVSAAFAGLRQVLDTDNGHLNVAVYNVGGKMVRKPFLELEEKDINVGWDANGRGLVLFSQAALPNLLSSVAVNPPHSPSLLLTGATASLRGGTQMASFAAGKFAMRAIGQSIAREFSPKGIHTVHFVIDGLIDTEATKGFKSKDEKINPDHIADAYWNAHIQPKSCWTQEMDLRPYIETF